MTYHDWKSMSAAEKTERLQALANDGLSASQIAALFLGASRSAVVGHCFRCGIQLQGRRPANRSTRPAVTRIVRPRVAKQRVTPKPRAAEPVAPSPETAVTFAEAIERRVCKWPMWDVFEGPDVSKGCGAPRDLDTPYCTYHARIGVGLGTRSERDADRQVERHCA